MARDMKHGISVTSRTYFLILSLSLSLCALGSHITIVAHSRSVQIALDAAKQLEGEGVDCEVGLRHSKQTSNSNEKKLLDVSIAVLTKSARNKLGVLSIYTFIV